MNTSEYILLDNHDPLLTPEAMAKAIGTTTGTLANWRSAGKGPAFIHLGDGPRAPIRYLPRQRVALTR